MKVLNLYSGLGGNRKNWRGVQVTAVEINRQVADIYKKLHPNDDVVLGDAHEYLLHNHSKFDFIWSSPPCQTHSQMNLCLKRRLYPDMSLYQEIILLQSRFDGLWVVENVGSYYDPLIHPIKKIGRHWFWSNFDFSVRNVSFGSNIARASREELSKWLGISYEGHIYLDRSKSHSNVQALRNCVHPEIGEGIMRVTKSLFQQSEGFGI